MKAFIGLLLVIGLLFVSSCTVVDPGTVGVRVSLGTVSPSPVDPGVAFRLPLVTTIKEVNVRHQVDSSHASCFSKDLQAVNVNYSVQYRIPATNAVKLYTDYSGDPLPTLITPRLYEALKQQSAQHDAEQLVQKRSEFGQAALQDLRKSLGDLIEITELNITNVDLSPQLSHAIEMKMVEQQKAQAKKYELERENQQAAITIVQAKAEAESIQIKAEALAKSPNFIELEIVKKWDGRSPSTVVTEGGGAKVILPVTK